MSSPAGPCEWCGGRQSWTFITGEMFVRCQCGCLPLPLEGVVLLPPDSECVETEQTPNDGTLREGGVVPCEGGEPMTRVSDESEDTELPW